MHRALIGSPQGAVLSRSQVRHALRLLPSMGRAPSEPERSYAPSFSLLEALPPSGPVCLESNPALNGPWVVALVARSRRARASAFLPGDGSPDQRLPIWFKGNTFAREQGATIRVYLVPCALYALPLLRAGR